MENVRRGSRSIAAALLVSMSCWASAAARAQPRPEPVSAAPASAVEPDAVPDVPELRLRPLDLSPLPPAPDSAKLQSRAVNSPRGEQCPAVFGGRPGLCFDADSAATVVRILHQAYPLAMDLLMTASRHTEVAQALRGVAKTWRDAFVGQRAVADLTRANYRSATERADRLADRVTAGADHSVWRYLGAFVAGAAVAVGITWAVRR